MPLTAAELKTQQYQWNIAHPRIVQSVYNPEPKDSPPAPRHVRMLDAATMNAQHLELVASAMRRSTAYRDQVTVSNFDAAATFGPAPRTRPSPGGEFDLESLLKHVGRTQPTSYEELNTWFDALSVPALHRIAITTHAEACGMLSRGQRYEGPVDLRGQPLPPDPDAARRGLEHEAEVAAALARSNRQHAMVDPTIGARVAPAPVNEHQPLPDVRERQARLLPPVDNRQAVPPGRTMHAAGTRVGDMSGATSDGLAAYDATSIEVAVQTAPHALAAMRKSLAKVEAAFPRRGRGYSC